MQRIAAAAMIAIVALSSFVLSGCIPPDPPDTDVTTAPKYNFSSFAGTAWRTKTKVALADLQGHSYLLAPRSFDSADPEYQPPPYLRVLNVLPAGTRLRVNRLMQSNGNGVGVRVTATLIGGTAPQRAVYLDYRLLAGNAFLRHDESLPKTWGVNSDLLEPDAPETQM